MAWQHWAVVAKAFSSHWLTTPFRVPWKNVLVLLSPGWLNKASIVSPVTVQADVRVILSPTVFCILSLAISEERKETMYNVILAILVNSLIIFFTDTRYENKLKFYINIEQENIPEKSGFLVCRFHEPCIYYYSVKAAIGVTADNLVILITVSL